MAIFSHVGGVLRPRRIDLPLVSLSFGGVPEHGEQPYSSSSSVCLNLSDVGPSEPVTAPPFRATTGRRCNHQLQRHGHKIAIGTQANRTILRNRPVQDRVL